MKGSANCDIRPKRKGDIMLVRILPDYLFPFYASHIHYVFWNTLFSILSTGSVLFYKHDELQDFYSIRKAF